MKLLLLQLPQVYRCARLDAGTVPSGTPVPCWDETATAATAAGVPVCQPGRWYSGGMKLLLLLLPQVDRCASLDADYVLVDCIPFKARKEEAVRYAAGLLLGTNLAGTPGGGLVLAEHKAVLVGGPGGGAEGWPR